MAGTSLRFPGAAALVLAAGCHPSRAEMNDVQAKLDSLAAQQQKILDAMAAQRGREQRAAAESGGVSIRGELANVEDKLDRLTASVEVLQEQVRPPTPTVARPQPGRPDPTATYKVEIGKSHVRGPKTALVTVVMWLDYQCPFCKRVQSTLDQLAKHYGRDIRFVQKHNPLPMHNRAMEAALAAEAAGRQGKFWKMHDKLFEDNRDLSDRRIDEIAKSLGLNLARFHRDMEDSDLRDEILAEQKQGATLGARGTPAFFINGRFLSGAQPLVNFETVIDEELKKARKLVDKGVPRRKVYAATIEHGKTSP